MALRLLDPGGMSTEPVRERRATGEHAPEREPPVPPLRDERVVPFEDDDEPDIEDIDLDDLVAID